MTMDKNDLLEQLAALAREQREAEKQLPAPAPLDAAARERITARALEALNPAPPGQVLRPKFQWVRRAAAPVMALAASLTVMVLWRGDSVETLPVYSLEARGGVAEMRGDQEPSQEPLRLTPDANIELVVRPTEAVNGPVGMQLFLTRGQVSRRIEGIDVDRSPDGAFRVRFSCARLETERAGEAELVVVVGRPEKLPREAPAAPGDGFQVLRQRVRLE
jgi:hypothetical protein